MGWLSGWKKGVLNWVKNRVGCQFRESEWVTNRVCEWNIKWLVNLVPLDGKNAMGYSLTNSKLYSKNNMIAMFFWKIFQSLVLILNQLSNVNNWLLIRIFTILMLPLYDFSLNQVTSFHKCFENSTYITPHFLKSQSWIYYLKYFDLDFKQ